MPICSPARAITPILILATSGAGAAPVAFVDFFASGSVELTTTVGNAPFTDGDVTQDGQIRTTLGGVVSSNAFSSTPGTTDGVDDATTILPAQNPMTGALTDTGDGVGFSTNVDAGFPAGVPISGRAYNFVSDVRVDLANNSTNGVFTVTMQVDFNETVDVEGADAFAELEFDLEVDNQDVFRTELLSDSFFGDEIDGVNQGTFGTQLARSGTFFFDVVLNPGDAALVQGFYSWDGAVYDGTASLADASIDLSIAGVTCVGECTLPSPVPLPGAVWLLASGLSGLALVGRRRGVRVKRRETA